MEQRIHMERTILVDPIKPILRSRNIIYVIIILSSIAFGAFGLASLYHWKEVQVFNEQRFQIEHELAAVKPADFMWAKQDAIATNLDKLLRLLKYASRLEDFYEAREGESFNNEQESIRQKEISDSARNDEQQEIMYASERSPFVLKKSAVIVPSDIVSVQEEKNLQDTTLEQKLDSAVPSSEVKWEWTLPSSAWLQLTPFMFNYEFEDATTDRTNSVKQ